MCKAEAAIRTQRVGPGRKGQARLGCPWGQREEARASPHRETWRTGGSQPRPHLRQRRRRRFPRTENSQVTDREAHIP